MRYLVVFLLSFPLIFLSSCKKGEDDPLISLVPRKNRVVGEWVLQKAEIQINDTVSTIENENVTSILNGSTLDDFEESRTFSFQETGEYSIVINRSYPNDWNGSSSQAYSIRFEERGNWNFTAGVGELREREQLILLPTYKSSQLEFAGSAVDVENIEGQNTALVYSILELRNDKIVLEYDKTITTGVGTEIDKTKLELEPA